MSQSLILITVLDLGIGGGGLRNQLTKLKAYNCKTQKEVFLCSFFLVLSLSVLVAIFLLSLVNQTESYIILSLSFIILRLPFSLYITGFAAYQQFGRKALCELSEVVIFCLSIYTLVYFQSSEKLLFVLAYFSLFLATVFSFVYFLKAQKWKICFVNLDKFKDLILPLIRINFQFWILNIFSLGLFAFCPFIINRLLSLEKTGDFCLFQRVVALILGVHFLAINSLWSGFSDALHRQDFYWIKKYLKKGILFTLGYFIIFGIIFVIFHNFMIFTWTGKTIQNYKLAIMFAISALVYGIVNMLSAILNSQNKLLRQIIYSFFGFFIHTFLGLVLGKIYSEVGVLLAFTLALIPLMISNIKEVKSLNIWSYASR